MGIRSVCLFCGSSMGSATIYATEAARLGRRLATAGVELVYGGGRRGLMGVAADAALAAGGRVVGIIPHFLNRREVEHTGVTELVVVDDMLERKRLMIQRSGAFIVLAGGLGTLDEAFEVLTWQQLGLLAGPVVFIDTEGYWQPLLSLVDRVVAEGFARPEVRRRLCFVADVPSALEALEIGSEG